MKEHRYILASNKVQKLNCPYCGAKKHWQRYVDIETGEILPEQHGRCDNESKCGQWVTPKETGYTKMMWDKEQGKNVELPDNQIPKRKEVKTRIIPATVYFDFETFRHTLQPDRYESNVFIQNLLTKVKFPFDADDVTRVIQLYRLGTVANGYRAGANTFPFIDINDNIRTIQVKQFDEKNHTTGTDFLHSIIEKHCTRNNIPLPEWLDEYKKQEKMVSCFFGEHLLRKYPGNPVALVEAPKSAIYGALYFGPPKKSSDLLWLAVYNLSSLTLGKCEALRGRRVILFPDLSKGGEAFKLWSQKAREHGERLKGTQFVLSDLLEKNANDADREKGLDLADYLIKMDWRQFRDHGISKEQGIELQNPLPAIEDLDHTAKKHDHLIPVEDVDIDIADGFLPGFIGKRKKDCGAWPVDSLIEFFDTADLPHAVQLDACTEIVDVKKFITGHLSVIKANYGNPTFQPYFYRLGKLKKLLNYEPKH